MIGKRFGKLVVLCLDEEQTQKNKNHAKSYVCKCDCGNVKTIRKNNLKSGCTTSCGCLVKEKTSINGKKLTIDLVGQKFGKLVVTRRKESDPNDPIKQRRVGAWWYTDCDCGTKDFVAKGSYLRAGRVMSCGCYNKEASHDKNMIDLTGEKYGMLTVVEEAVDMRKYRSIVWRCVCDCGNETFVSSNSLRTGGTVSCGCLNSKNEMIIKNHLSDLKINFKQQYYYDDLRSPLTGRILKFDIAVLDNNDQVSFLIEYDGEQHEYGTRYSSNQEENIKKFERTKIYDELKNKYCKKNGIDLLRISFRDKKDMLSIIDNKLKQKGML